LAVSEQQLAIFETLVNENLDWSFLNFLENSVVHERNVDAWEFGKGALSANVIFFDKHSQATSGYKPSYGLKAA